MHNNAHQYPSFSITNKVLVLSVLWAK
uniref:Uncharacterized protein n=1 Tax=Anguilla anguilla TaxID=7936 RepID=A0A0E9R217_ANGAN